MTIAFDQLGLNLNDVLIVAVSGGPDSVALLHLLKQTGFEQIIVAHLDHKIRQSSYQDAQLVMGLAMRLNYQIVMKQVDIRKLAEKEQENLESIGRRERYAFFRELKEKHHARFIITAHHADDQIETVLMNLIRGCGLEGLGGMQEVEGDIWRPLLRMSKEELLGYCQEHRLSFLQDESNQDEQYRRNFLRKKVVPHLKALNPNLLGTMRNNIRVWQQAAEYFQKRAELFLEEGQERPPRYDVKRFLKLDDFEQQNVLRALFEQVHGHKQNLILEHVDQVLKVLRSNVSGKRKEFGPGKVLVREKGFFEVRDV
ncbi:MAG: tRNA lysidine(34) synthetase TilS [bacterium]|nr:tRNA lysidine(34) synthetase TilS [bacterium]